MAEQEKSWSQRKLRMSGVRLSQEALEAIRLESECTGRSVSETLRLITNRHVGEESRNAVLLEKLDQLHTTLRELGRDIETVTRLFLVASKFASEDDSRDWCKQNLKVGR